MSAGEAPSFPALPPRVHTISRSYQNAVLCPLCSGMADQMTKHRDHSRKIFSTRVSHRRSQFSERHTIAVSACNTYPPCSRPLQLQFLENCAWVVDESDSNQIVCESPLSSRADSLSSSILRGTHSFPAPQTRCHDITDVLDNSVRNDKLR
jgi:hypothetical protein